MELTPEKIFKDFIDKKIDKNTAVDLLISLIDNTDYEDTRIECIEKLNIISVKNDKIFHYMENLLISDLNAKVRWPYKTSFGLYRGVKTLQLSES